MTASQAPPAGNAGELYATLKQRGILLRHFDQPGIAPWLRIAIGTDEEMDSLIRALQPLPGPR